jgi:putative redox protein
VGEPNVWSVARLPDAEHRNAAVTVNGFELACEIPADDGPEPAGATPFGLLAGSLSACTAMSVRDFLHRWRIEPGEVVVHVSVHPGTPPMLDRRVTVAGAVEPDLREQLAAAIDNTPVTRLLLEAVPIRTVLTTGRG